MIRWEPGEEVLGEYLIEKELGRGGMGCVWLVKSQSTGRHFAVKQALIRDEKHRKAFLAELQTWIDLPEHPNIVPCRFFRTVGDEIVIFADYVEGGSLADWIAKGKLTGLEQIIDVAIQFAWGLHTIHERGLIHQDVKPGNVMMTAAGVPMVTDFGLAQARLRGKDGAFVSPALSPGEESVLVSVGGMTPAYASPEQRAGQLLSRKTDIWSWGVSVLEMFTGEVTWSSGVAAADVLDGYLAQDPEDEVIPAMPAGVAEVLRVCFHADQGRRWESLGQAVELLKGVYRQATGGEYTRALDTIERRSTAQAGVGERRMRGGTSWTDPRTWLEKALRADGRDPAEAAAIVARQAASRRGQLVAELATYDEARRIYEHLVQAGRKDLEKDLAILCMEAAFVHLTADDSQGGLALYDQAIEIHERLVNQEGRPELSNDLANTYHNKAGSLSDLGDKRGAVALYDQAIAIRERLINQEGRRELAGDLANTYQNKAIVVRSLGDNQGAVALFDRVIEIHERQVNQEGRRELANALAAAYQNKAGSLSDLGDNRGAVALHDRAIEIRERLVNQEGRRELANALATVYQNKALAVSHLGDNRSAVPLFDRAIEIRERLVNQEGRRELADDLANTYQNKAASLHNLGNNHDAVVLFDQAIKIRERLVNQEGWRELANALANMYQNKAVSLSDLGDKRGAVALYDQAIAIRERLVNQEGRRELANVLAGTYQNKALAVSDLGDKRGAVTLYDQAIVIWERLVNQEGRRELVGDLARSMGCRAVVLLQLGETDRGKREARAAMAILRAEIERTGRTDLKSALSWIAGQVGEK